MKISYSHTFAVRDPLSERTCYKCCSFQSSPIKAGSKVHKGVLLDSTGREPAAVKLAPSEEEAGASLRRYQFGCRVLRGCPAAASKATMVKTFQSQIEKVGRRADSGRLHENQHVVVQLWAEGPVRVLYSHKDPSSSSDDFSDSGGGGDGRRRQDNADADVPECIMELVRASYEISRGQQVIGEVEASEERDDNGNSVYHITSLTVHSRAGAFGLRDEGLAGVEEVARQAGLPPVRPPPSAPDLPPSYEEASGSAPQGSAAGNREKEDVKKRAVVVEQDWPGRAFFSQHPALVPRVGPHHLHDYLHHRLHQEPSAGINIPLKANVGEWAFGGISPPVVLSPDWVEQIGQREDLRKGFSEEQLNVVLGSPPSYRISSSV